MFPARRADMAAASYVLQRQAGVEMTTSVLHEREEGELVAINLFTQLMNEFTGDTLSSVATGIGETAGRTQSALGGVLPALIGGCANKASTTDQANEFLDLIKRNNFDLSTYSSAANALKVPGGVTELISTGRPLVDSLFGTRSGPIADWVSSLSGIGRSSSSSLLGLALPILMGQIARYLKSNGWSASNLMSLLGGQRAFLQDAPAGLAKLLGAEETKRYAETYETEGTRYATSEPIRANEPTAPIRYETAPKSRIGWWWALPALLLALLLGNMLTHRRQPIEVAVIQTVPAPRVVAPPAPAAPTIPATPMVGTSGREP